MPAGKWCSIAGTKKTGSYTAGQPVLRETHCGSENCRHIRTLFTWMLQVWHGRFGGGGWCESSKLNGHSWKSETTPAQRWNWKDNTWDMGQVIKHLYIKNISPHFAWITRMSRLLDEGQLGSGQNQHHQWMQSNFNLSVTVPGMPYGESWRLSKLLVGRMQKLQKVRSRMQKSNFQVERIKGAHWYEAKSIHCHPDPTSFTVESWPQNGRLALVPQFLPDFWVVGCELWSERQQVLWGLGGCKTAGVRWSQK